MMSVSDTFELFESFCEVVFTVIQIINESRRPSNQPAPATTEHESFAQRRNHSLSVYPNFSDLMTIHEVVEFLYATIGADNSATEILTIISIASSHIKTFVSCCFTSLRHNLKVNHSSTLKYF